LYLFLILFLSTSVFAQDTPAPPAQSNAAGAKQTPATAESEVARKAALAKAVQNPVADMISVPLQNNTNFGIGPYQRDQDVLNIQPVIPFHLTKLGPDHANDSAHRFFFSAEEK
jgi:hypothetical protein